MDLVYKNEKILFGIAVALATVFWLVIIVATFGVALIYVLFAFLIYLFVQSGFIAYVKGNGVRVTAEQYPDLYAGLTECCQKAGVATRPEMYLLRADFFNALATRFLGKDMIVLFTDVVDALDDRPDAINFYIGHELGHVHRGHLKWSGFLVPVLWLPVLGTGYRRAQEYTCDRYGARSCDSEEGLKAALAAISAGDTRWKTLNADAFAAQIAATSGFWMSFHEFTSDYPWMTKRMASALAFRRNETIRHPRRSFFAGLLSIFVPRIGVGAGGVVSVMIVVAIIGILAAIAIPAYQDYTIRAQVSEGLSLAAAPKSAVTEFVQQREEWPLDNDSVGLIPAGDIRGNYVSSVAVDEGLIVVTYGNNAADAIQGLSIVLVPDASELPLIRWDCYSENIPARWLPAACRGN